MIEGSVAERSSRLWRGLLFAIVLAPKVHLHGAALACTIGLHCIAPAATLIGWLLFGPPRPHRPRHRRLGLRLARATARLHPGPRRGNPLVPLSLPEHRQARLPHHTP